MAINNQRFQQRPGVGRFPTDREVKRIFAQTVITLPDGPFEVAGKLIAYRRTHAGALGAIIANPITGRRFLYCIDFVTGRPRYLERLT